MKIHILAVLFILGVLTLSANLANANTDYGCVNQCTSAGYMYGLCVEKCSYNTQPQYTPPIQQQRVPMIDYTCVNQCTARGMVYQYCTQACSY